MKQAIHEVMSACFLRDFKVYPVVINHQIFIQISMEGETKTLGKPISGTEAINSALEKTYRYYYEKYFNKEEKH
jgi:hypothetical protein